MIGCAFCNRVVRLIEHRDELGEAWYWRELEDLFDLADRTRLLHIAYQQRQRRRKRI